MHERPIEQVTITFVIEFPESDYCRIRVNFESRKGICYCPLLNAKIALPRHDKDKFILIAYSSPYPETLVFDTF